MNSNKNYITNCLIYETDNIFVNKPSDVGLLDNENMKFMTLHNKHNFKLNNFTCEKASVTREIIFLSFRKQKIIEDENKLNDKKNEELKTMYEINNNRMKKELSEQDAKTTYKKYCIMIKNILSSNNYTDFLTSNEHEITLTNLKIISNDTILNLIAFRLIKDYYICLFLDEQNKFIKCYSIKKLSEYITDHFNKNKDKYDNLDDVYFLKDKYNLFIQIVTIKKVKNYYNNIRNCEYAMIDILEIQQPDKKQDEQQKITELTSDFFKLNKKLFVKMDTLKTNYEYYIIQIMKVQYRKIFKYHMILYDPITKEKLNITSNDFFNDILNELDDTQFKNIFIVGVHIILMTLTIRNNKLYKCRQLDIVLNLDCYKNNVIINEIIKATEKQDEIINNDYIITEQRKQDARED